MNLTNLKNSISSLEKDVHSLKGQISLLREQIDTNSNNLVVCDENKETFKKAIEILIHVQEHSQKQIKEAFEEICSYALSYIYSSDYKFKVEFDRRGNLGTMDFFIESPECSEPLSIIDTRGGGIVDIVSFALRVVLLQLSNNEGSLILDESFKHVSKEFRESCSLFLNEINKKLNKQIIMISHAEEFKNPNYNIIEIK